MNRTLNFLLDLPWETWITEAITIAQTGQFPRYIPLLNQANSHSLALAIWDHTGEVISSGDQAITFPLMSVIKPFLLLYLLSLKGKNWVIERVGQAASDLPFNSLEQLQWDHGFPRNPMINSGAIRLAAELSGATAQERCLSLQNWLNQYIETLCFLDEAMLESVRSLPNQKNQALAQTMAEAGYLENWPLALETYNYICCLSVNIRGLANLGQLLINSSLDPDHCQFVQEMMTSCGLYEYSAPFAQKVSLPSKSGVSGIILAVIPNQGAIAVYSPPLDLQGNSMAGLYLLKNVAARLQK